MPAKRINANDRVEAKDAGFTLLKIYLELEPSSLLWPSASPSASVTLWFLSTIRYSVTPRSRAALALYTFCRVPSGNPRP